MMSASRPDAGSAVVTLDAGEQKETIRSAEATVSVDAPAIVRQPRPPTIRSMLVWTAIVWVIPPWICIVAAILLFYQHERAHIAESTASIAQVLMGTVDRYLAGKTAALQILAISPYLKSGDLAGFHREASEIAQQLFETNIVLTEPSGRQVVNTLVSYGEPLPLHGASPQQGQVLATGRPVVSDVFFGPVMKKQVMAAAVPVFGGDEVAYVLAAGILPERLRELLVHQGLQPDWVVSIFDTSGVIAARTHDFERFVGQKGSPALLAAMQGATAGIVDAPTLEGLPVIAAFTRSEVSNWTVAIGIPVAELYGQLWWYLQLSGAGALILLGISVALASYQSSRIARAVQALIAPAVAIGRGEIPRSPRLRVREADDVAQSLERASLLLRSRTVERDQAESRLSAIFNHTLDGLISMNGGGIIEHFNPACERIFGYASAEVVGQNVKMLMPEPDHSKHDEYLRHYAQTGEAAIIGTTGREVKGKRKNGASFPAELNVSAFMAGDETVFVGIIRDISVRKQVEENNSMLLAAIVSSSDDAIVSKTTEGVITSWNASAERMFGYSREFAVGRHVNLIVPPEREDEEKEILNRLKNGEQIQHFATVRKNKNGRHIDVSLTVSPVRDVAGRIAGASKIVRDISREKQAEAELLKYMRALECSNKEMEEFAYAASHDLKAPLRVIDNASKWLEEDLAEHLTEETRESMALMRGRVGRMEKLLEDLLEYSRVGRSIDHNFAQIVAGDALLGNILVLLAPPQQFKVKTSAAFADISVCVMPLQQILMNLIGNAIKHHDKSEGTIEVTVEDVGPNYVFAVKDDGPGIPPQFHERIFKMFQTLKPRDQVEGSGMGLAIVRKNVEVFGGTLDLESPEGRGSVFRFTWPKQQRRRGEDE